ncbi:hypothetical protein [Streptomyces sp. NPDC056983]|uniref:hypothetical protein n=1 Tax=Streptomyces sp. NPDC056983 TaxID=3345987 RepID=UPI00363B909B
MRRHVIAVLTLTLMVIAGVTPSWASPRDRPPSANPAAAVAQPKARTSAHVPKPPKAMTLGERRKQVTKERSELSPLRDYMESPKRTGKGTPHARPGTGRLTRGPAAEASPDGQRLAAAPMPRP